MRVQLDKQIGLDVLQRVTFDVSIKNLDVFVEPVLYDVESLHAPVARIRMVASKPTSTDGLLLQLSLSVKRNTDGKILAHWTSELDHDDLEVGPYDVAGNMASKSMECDGMFTARAWYTRALPRQWIALDVSVSSLAVWQLL